MKFITVTHDNIDEAVAIQRAIFKEDAYVNYFESVEHLFPGEYWIVESGGKRIGVAGIYLLETDPKSAWLGWFGILKEYRRKGYGTEALKLFEKIAKARGFKYSRLYTNRFDNERARAFYQFQGYREELYMCAEDFGSGTVSIFSKSLDEKYEAPPWGIRSIRLADQKRKEADGEMTYRLMHSKEFEQTKNN